MTGIRFVYFDLDDTLLDHRQAQHLALVDLHGMLPTLGEVPLRKVHSTYREVNGKVWREYAAGTRSKEGTRSGRFELLFEALGIEADAMVAADKYLEAYADHWELHEGALEVFDRVTKRYPTGVLTNGFAEAQRAKLARFPHLTAAFSAIVISEEEGVLKPHPELFRIATARAGVGPAEILYVGDSLHSDVVGGLNAGWQVAWYTDGEEVAGEPRVFRFSDWTDLAGLLRV
ncbi:MAG: HAD-IA family hydrolase [Rhodothermales bacterium]|nr:HAD-IA family hydrolase [Rhodothermales bacterium]